MHGQIPLHLILLAIALALGPASQIDVRTKAVRQLRHGQDRPRHSRAAFALRAGRATDSHGSQTLGKCDRGPHLAGPPSDTGLTATSDKRGVPQIPVRHRNIPASAGENDLIVILKRNPAPGLPRVNGRVRKAEIERERTN